MLLKHGDISTQMTTDNMFDWVYNVTLRGNLLWRKECMMIRFLKMLNSDIPFSKIIKITRNIDGFIHRVRHHQLFL